MIFLYNSFLYLLFFIPVIIFFLLYNILRGKTIKYPSIVFFSDKNQISGKYFRYIKNILKILLILSIFVLIILFLARPYTKSNIIEYLVFYVDNTNNQYISNTEINKIIDSIINDTKIKFIKIYNNNSEFTYPLKTNIFENNSIFTKQEVLMRFYSKLNALKSPSIKYVFLTNRKYAEFTQEILKTNNTKLIQIIEIYPHIVVYSDIDVKTRIYFYKYEQLTYKSEIELKRGYNYFYKDNILYNKIVIANDTVILNDIYKMHKIKVNYDNKNKYIRNALKILGYDINKNANVSIVINKDIEKGIVFTDIAENFNNRKSDILMDWELEKYIKSNFVNLKYIKLGNWRGKNIVFSQNGDNLIVYKDSVFYVNLPIDTSYSNILLLPEFLPLLDFMINKLITNPEVSEIDKKLLNYKYTLLDKNVYMCSNTNIPKLSYIGNLFFYGGLICAMFLFILSLFL